MPGDIAYKLTADEAQALQAVSRLTREFGLTETAVKKAAEATKELDRETQQMGREGERVFERTRTEAEQYAEKLARLGELHEKNAISTDTYSRAVQQVKAEHEGAFGAKAGQQMLDFANSFLPSITAASALRDILGEVADMRQRGAEADRAAAFDEGSLAELAEADPAKFKGLLATSRQMSADAGMSRQQAAKLTFAAESANMSDALPEFAEAYKQGVVSNPENLLRSTAGFRKAFGERMPGEEILNLAFGAAKASPSKASELLAASADAAPYAEAAGASEQEVLAGTAINATVMDPEGGAKRGGTATRALLASLARLRSGKPQMEGGLEVDEEGHPIDVKGKKLRQVVRNALSHAEPGLLGELHAIESLHLDNSQIQTLMGRKEGVIAYSNILRAEHDFKDSLERQKEAQRTGLYHKTLALTTGDPQIQAANMRRIEESRGSKAESDRFGSEQDTVEAVLAHEQAQEIGRGDEWTAAFSKFSHKVSKEIGIPGTGRRQAQYLIREGVLDDDPALLTKAVQGLGGEDAVYGAKGGFTTDTAGREKFERAMEKLDRAANSLQAAADAHQAAATGLKEASAPSRNQPLVPPGVRR